MRCGSLLGFWAGVAAAAPAELAYTGRVHGPSGGAIVGTHDLTVRLYDGPGDTATTHWTRTYVAVPVDDGYFSVVLATSDSGAALDTRWFAGSLWVGVAVDGAELGRQRLLDVPRAALATHIPVESSGTTGTCADVGAIVYDTGAGGLRVCDGSKWKLIGNTTLLEAGGVRQWSDGSVAESCRNYRYPAGDRLYAGATGTGTYRIDPDGTGGTFGTMDVYCEMDFDQGGWTRVSTIILNTSCNFGTGASGDPRVGGNCTKYTDAAINAIAQDKVFVSRIPGYASAYTKYAGSIAVNGSPGPVIQGDSLAAVVNATPNLPTQYSGWLYFHQQNWYNTDRCRGASANTARLSLEYMTSASPKYACTGNCSADCPTTISGVLAEIYIR